MANIKSAKKRILVNQTKHENNVPKKSSMKTAVKKAIANPSNETVNEAYKRIDKALAKLGAACNFSFKGEALTEQRRTLVFEIEF